MIIGNREIGYGSKPVISAELGLNHNGDLDTALKMIKSVADNGGDGVKLQYFDPDDFITDKEKTYTYKQLTTEIPEKFGDQKGIWTDGKTGQRYRQATVNYWQLFKDHQISLDFVEQCKNEADRLGLLFGVTCFSPKGVNEINEIGVDYFKMASQSFDDRELATAMRETKKQLIFSTGHISLKDLEDNKIGYLLSERQLVLHCVSEYPAKHSKLWKIPRMIKMGYLTGFSNHSIGIDNMVRACELGAVFVETHYTLSQYDSGPDHSFSTTPSQLKELSQAI